MLSKDNFFAEKLSSLGKSRPQKSILVCKGRSVTYGDLLAFSCGFGKICAQHGLNPKTPVLVSLPHDAMLAIGLWTLCSQGIPALCTYNHQGKLASVSSLLKAFPFRAVISTREKLALLGAVKTISLSSLTGSFSDDDIELGIFDVSSEVGFSWLLMTSGSTGQPKVVMLSAESLRDRVQGEMSLFELSDTSWLLNLLPFSHDLGLNQLLCTLAAGATLEMNPSALLVEQCKMFENPHFTGVTGMPELWRSYLHYWKDRGFQSMYSGYLTVSGGSMQASELRELRRIFPKARILKTYGQTETFRSLVEVEQDQIENDALGVPLAGVEVELINDRGHLCAEGEIGELVHFGEGVMSGYWNDVKATKRKFFVRPEDSSRIGVLTGDLFQLLRQGRYKFVGRRDDMVKHYGHRFHLAEVESQIRSSGLVKDVGAVLVALPDRWQGLVHKLVAFVSPINAEDSHLQQKLRAFCLNSMEKYKVPQEFHVLSDLPKTASYKLDRPRLVQDFQRYRETQGAL